MLQLALLPFEQIANYILGGNRMVARRVLGAQTARRSCAFGLRLVKLGYHVCTTTCYFEMLGFHGMQKYIIEQNYPPDPTGGLKLNQKRFG